MQSQNCPYTEALSGDGNWSGWVQNGMENNAIPFATSLLRAGNLSAFFGFSTSGALPVGNAH
jgi:hypothetical protein